MFIVTLGDVIGIGIFLVIIVGCIIYFVHESFENARYLKGYHKPSKKMQALQAQKDFHSFGCKYLCGGGKAGLRGSGSRGNPLLECSHG